MLVAKSDRSLAQALFNLFLTSCFKILKGQNKGANIMSEQIGIGTVGGLLAK
ncbi:hypothetical protein P7D46_13095 [Enterococcus dongliensis]|nr:hypothetical protein [Enterococcus dongliensis]